MQFRDSISIKKLHYNFSAYATLCIFFLLHTYLSLAATKTSAGSGNWSTISWTPSAPVAGDDVVINAGDIVTVNGAVGSFNSLTINGTLNWTGINTITVNGGGDVNLASGGNLTGSVAGVITTSGNLIVNSTATSTTVNITMTGTAKTITGTGSIGALTISGTTSNNGTLTITTTLAGASTLTNSTTGTLNIGAATVTPTLTATAAGNTVNYNAAGTQTVKGTTYHHLTISGSGTKTLGAATILNGNLTVSAGTLASSTLSLTVNGTSNFTGSFTDASNTGTDIFVGAVTLNSGCVWTSTAVTTAASMVFQGGITNNATTFSAAAATFNTNSQALGGATTYTFSGSVVCTGVTVTNNGTVTMSSTGAGALSGTGGWTQGANSTLNYAGSTITVTTRTFTGSPNTVNYNRAGTQTINGTTYHHLTVSGSGTKTLGAATILNGNLTVSAGTLATSTFNFTVNGTSSFTGSFTDASNTGIDVFVGAVTINSGCTWTSTSVTTSTNLEFRNGIANSGTAFSGGAATFTTNNQAISGTTTTSFSGAVVVTGIILTNNSTVTMTSTAAAALSGTGGWTQGANSTLNYAGSTITVTTRTFTGSPNTINYNRAGNQTINGTTYHHLTVSGSGTKTLGAATILNGNLTVSAGTLATSTFDFTVTGTSSFTGSFTDASNTGIDIFTGAVTINSGCTWTSTSVTTSTNLEFRNGISNAGTAFSGGAATFTTNNQAISGATTTSFSGAVVVTGIILTNNSTVTMSSTAAAALSGTGSFVQGSGSSFNYAGSTLTISAYTFSTSTNTVTYTSAAAQTVYNVTYHHLSFSGAGTKTLNGNLTVNGNLSVAAGTFDLGTTATTVTISGTTAVAGTLTFNGTTTKSVTLTGNLSGAGTINMSGGSLLHDLFLGGATNTITTLTTAAVASTITYNRAGAQTMISSANYRNVTISGSGTKTGGATTTINNNLTISAGTFDPNTGNLTVTGTTSITGSFSDGSNTGADIFVGAVTLNAGSTWTSTSVTTAASLVFRGGITNNATTFSAAAATFNTNAQALGGSTTYSFSGAVSFASAVTVNTNLTLSGALTVTASSINNATFSSSSTVTITGAAVTFTNNSTAGLTNTGAAIISGTGGWVQGANSTLNYSGSTLTVTTRTFNGNPNTVNYNATTQTIAGATYHHLTISAAGTKTLGAATILNGNLTVSAGTLAPSTLNLTVNGTSNFTGSFTDASATGTNTFVGAVTLNSGCTWTSTAVTTAASMIFQNGIVNNSTAFSANAATFNTNSQALTGSTAYSFSGFIVVTGVTLTNNCSVTMSGTAAAVLSGTGGWTQGANSTLNYAGSTLTVTTRTFTGNPNTVNYNRAGAQTVNGTTYHHLTISGSGTKTLGATTVLNGNLTVSAGTLEMSTFDFTVNGTSTFTGLFSDNSNTGTDIFVGAVTINAAATWTSTSVTTAAGLVFRGGITHNNNTSNTFLASSATFNTNAQALGGTGTFNFSGTGVTVTGITLTNNTTVNMTNTGAGVLNGSGEWAQGANSTLNYAGSTITITTGTFNGSPNTFSYNAAGAQTVFPATYHHVSLAGTGTKTLGGAITANGNLTISSALDVSGSNYAIDLKGNWSNTGTFTCQTGTVTFSGTGAQTIGGSTETFNNITLSNASVAGVSITSAHNLTGVLTLGANSTFTTTGQTFTLKSTATASASIAAIPASATFTGNITLERFTTGGSTGWTCMGNPIIGSTISDWTDDFNTSGFTGSTVPSPSTGFVSIYTYDETVTGVQDNGYIAPSNVTDATTPGTGFFVYLGDGGTTTNNLTIDVTGAPKTGDVSLPISYTNTGSAIDDGWNLIANPYPSPILWSSLRSNAGTPANIDDAIYIWNPDLNGGTGGFAQYVNGVSSPATGSGGIDDNIPTNQAFFVHLTGSTTLTATESIKTSGNPTFLKLNAGAVANTQSIQNLFRIYIDGQTYHDETVIRLHPNATENFDNSFDALKLSNNVPEAAEISTLLNNVNYSINSIPEFGADIIIPIKIKIGTSGNYTISGDGFKQLSNSSCIILEDSYTHTTIDFKHTPSYTTFIADTTAGIRFFLHLNYQVISYSRNATCNGANNGAIYVEGNSTVAWGYQLSSTTGKTIVVKNNILGSDSATNLPAGEYIIHYYGINNCSGGNDTLIITEPDPIKALFIFSSDTLDLANNQPVYISNKSENSTTFEWDFGDGQKSFAKNNLYHNYDSTGIYTVSLKSTNACSSDIYSKQLVVINSYTPLKDTTTYGNSDTTRFVGITPLSQINTNEIEITKQENQIKIALNFNSSNNCSIILYSVNGQLIYSQNIKTLNDVLYIDTSNLSNEIYVLSIITNNKQINQKIIN